MSFDVKTIRMRAIWRKRYYLREMKLIIPHRVSDLKSIRLCDTSTYIVKCQAHVAIRKGVRLSHKNLFECRKCQLYKCRSWIGIEMSTKEKVKRQINSRDIYQYHSWFAEVPMSVRTFWSNAIIFTIAMTMRQLSESFNKANFFEDIELITKSRN